MTGPRPRADGLEPWTKEAFEADRKKKYAYNERWRAKKRAEKKAAAELQRKLENDGEKNAD